MHHRNQTLEAATRWDFNEEEEVNKKRHSPRERVHHVDDKDNLENLHDEAHVETSLNEEQTMNEYEDHEKDTQGTRAQSRERNVGWWANISWDAIILCIAIVFFFQHQIMSLLPVCKITPRDFKIGLWTIKAIFKHFDSPFIGIINCKVLLMYGLGIYFIPKDVMQGILMFLYLLPITGSVSIFSHESVIIRLIFMGIGVLVILLIFNVLLGGGTNRSTMKMLPLAAIMFLFLVYVDQRHQWNPNHLLIPALGMLILLYLQNGLFHEVVLVLMAFFWCNLEIKVLGLYFLMTISGTRFGDFSRSILRTVIAAYLVFGSLAVIKKRDHLILPHHYVILVIIHWGYHFVLKLVNNWRSKRSIYKV